MPQLKFTDVAKRKVFTTNKFKVIAKKTRVGIRYFAVTKAPSGNMAYRIISKDLYMKIK